MPCFVPGDLDLQTRERGTKHVIHVNFVQIRSAVPGDISHKHKKTQTDGARNRTFRSSLRAVITTNSRFRSQRPRESGLASYPTTNLGIYPHFEEVRSSVEPWLMARWKACVEFLLSVIELLFLSLTVEALQGKMCQNSLPLGGDGSV